MNLYEVQIREGRSWLADSLYDDLDLASFEAERRARRDGVVLRIIRDRDAGRMSPGHEVFYTTGSTPGDSETGDAEPDRDSGLARSRVRPRHLVAGGLALAATVLWLLSRPA